MSHRKEARARADHLLSEFRSSGLTQRAFCERFGVKLPTLCYWIARERSEQQSARTPTRDTFVPVVESASVPRAEAAHLTVHFPSGLQITVECGYPVEDLQQIAKALSAVEAC